MANPNTPSGNEMPEGKDLKDIKQLDLKKVGGVRDQVKHIVGNAAKIAVFAGAVGAVTGHYVQEGYRNLTHYSGDPAHPALVAEPDKEPAPEPEPEKKGFFGTLFDKAKGTAKEVMGETDAYKKMIEKKKEFNEFKTGMLEAGDKMTFWGPFSIAFLAAALAASRFLAMKKKLLGTLDPVEQAKFDAVEKKINTIIDRLNVLSKKPVLTASEIAELKAMREEFEKQTKGLEK
jgi:hypothetical protein